MAGTYAIYSHFMLVKLPFDQKPAKYHGQFLPQLGMTTLCIHYSALTIDIALYAYSLFESAEYLSKC